MQDRLESDLLIGLLILVVDPEQIPGEREFSVKE